MAKPLQGALHILFILNFQVPIPGAALQMVLEFMSNRLFQNFTRPFLGYMRIQFNE